MKPKRFLANAYENRTAAETAAYYDRWAEVYDDELTENDYRQPERCAAALALHLPDQQARILDAGCGTGLSGLALARAGYRVIDGCDFSPGMLEKAAKTKIYANLFKTDLNTPLAVADGAYRAIAAVGVFSFGHVKAGALDEFVRITQPGSPIIIGLNDHFFQEGSLATKLDDLSAKGVIKRVSQEPGEHIPGIDLPGWVIVARRL